MSDTFDPPFPSEPDGLSLDALSEAYAQATGRSPKCRDQSDGETQSAAPEDDSAISVAEEGAEEAAPPDPEELAEEDDEDPCPVCPRTILEAMLFVGSPDNRPLTAAQAAALMRGVSPEEIPGLVDEINQRYASNGCPYEIVGEGSGYRLALRKEFHRVRSKFYGRTREARLSQAALDVLAIVAYRQPITAEEVSRLRDIPANAILAQLVRRELLRIERPTGKRRPVTYHTTQRFLDLFGLESIDDLPQAEDMETHL